MTNRRSRGDGALFQRGDGMWVGRVDLGWKDGKRRSKTVYGSTKTQCQEKLKAAKAEVAKGNRLTASMTVGPWLERWLTEVLPATGRVRPQTLRNYRSYADQYLVPALGRVRLDRLEPQHVRDLHAHVRGKGLSETTVGHAHRILSTALADAMREGLVFRNVVSLVPKPAEARADVRSLSLVETQRFFAAVDGDRNASRWHMAFLMGTRQGETLGLQRSLIDLETGTLDVSWQLQRIPWAHGCANARQCDGYHPRLGATRCPDRRLATLPGFEYRHLRGNLCLVRPKTAGSERLLPIPGPLLVSFNEHLERTAGEPNPHGLMWTTDGVAPIEAAADRKQWHSVLAAADIPDTNQHAARHTTNTLLIELGVPEDVRMMILGQSTAAANQRYSHADLEVKRRALETLGAQLRLSATLATPPSITEHH